MISSATSSNAMRGAARKAAHALWRGGPVHGDGAPGAILAYLERRGEGWTVVVDPAGLSSIERLGDILGNRWWRGSGDGVGWLLAKPVREH